MLSNETLAVRVLEIDYSKEIVKFKKTALPEGPTYTEYLDHIFLINLQNAPTIYNDPYENPYPGYQSVVPISMKRLERYSLSEIELHQNRATASLEHFKSIDEEIEIRSSNQERFDVIFQKVLKTTLQYCKSRKFSLAEDYDWNYVYLECSPDLNGYCLVPKNMLQLTPYFYNAGSFGNGKFYFSELLFQGLSEDAIAGIIAHEFGHSLAKHSLEQIRKDSDKEKIANWTAFGITLAHGGSYARNRKSIEFVADAFFMRPYERKHETEADKIGAVLMTLAGFDPTEIVKYWRTGDRATHTHFMDTHPGGLERATNIERFISSPEFQILTKKR